MTYLIHYSKIYKHIFLAINYLYLPSLLLKKNLNWVVIQLNIKSLKVFTAWNVFKYKNMFLVRTFPCLDWIQRITNSAQVQKNTDRKNLSIWTIFKKWLFTQTIIMRLRVKDSDWKTTRTFFAYKYKYIESSSSGNETNCNREKHRGLSKYVKKETIIKLTEENIFTCTKTYKTYNHTCPRPTIRTPTSVNNDEFEKSKMAKSRQLLTILSINGLTGWLVIYLNLLKSLQTISKKKIKDLSKQI